MAHQRLNVLFRYALHCILLVSVSAQTTPAAASVTGTSSSTTTSAPAYVQTTIRGIIGTWSTAVAASVVSADACSTALALQCTESDAPICKSAAGATITVTFGPDAYRYVFLTSESGAKATVGESCALETPPGTPSTYTKGTCTFFLAYGDATSSTTSSTVVTLSDPASFNYAQIPITAGANNLPVAELGEATCTAAAANGDASGGQGSSTNVGAIAGGTVGGVVGLALVGVLAWFLLRKRRQQKKQHTEENGVAATEKDGCGDQTIPVTALNDSSQPIEKEAGERQELPADATLGGKSGKFAELDAPAEEKLPELDSPQEARHELEGNTPKYK